MSQKRDQTKRPGFRVGQTSEFMVIAPLKPGGADRLRKKFPAGFSPAGVKQIDGVGTVHDLRFTIFAKDTMLVFCSVFDGDWDSYIHDFSTFIPEALDLTFEELEGYPGIRSPEVKDFILKYQVTATAFYSAHPDATVKQVKSALKTKAAFEALLDTASG